MLTPAFLAPGPSKTRGQKKCLDTPPPCRSPPLVVLRGGGGGGGGRHLVNPKFFVAAHCVVVWVTVLWGTAACIPCTHGRTFCSLSLKGHSRREMGSQKSACACQASYQEGKTTAQECCPKHSSGKWRACARVQGEVEQDQEILRRAGQGVGLRTLAAL